MTKKKSAAKKAPAKKGKYMLKSIGGEITVNSFSGTEPQAKKRAKELTEKHGVDVKVVKL